jgi:hypothetical protein
MKIARLGIVALALTALPGMAFAQGTPTEKQPGASRYAPGQKAQQPGGDPAKTYAPGQRMKSGEKPVKGTTGASGFAPGQQMNRAKTDTSKTNSDTTKRTR